MAHDKSTPENHNEAGGNRRFRLPKLFADSDDTAPEIEETTERIAQRASALGVKLPAPVEEEVIVAANRPYEGAPRASVLRMSPEEAAAEMTAQTPNIKTPNVSTPSVPTPSVPTPNVQVPTSPVEAHSTTQDAPAEVIAETTAGPARAAQAAHAAVAPTGAAQASRTPPLPARSAPEKPDTADDSPLLAGTSAHDVVGLGVAGAVARPTPSGPVPIVHSEAARAAHEPVPTPQRVLETDRHMMQKLDTLEEGMEEMSRLLQEICDRGTAQEKVFDTLHSELQDYKNDFIYEHLKPVVRPLLFLYDSLEQFEEELAQQERPQTDERRRGLSPALVRQNMAFFREQLVEALRICEVTPMQTPEGMFDPKCHKAIDIALVEAEQENMIQRVVRSGWYLNGHVFRPAEVVVGRTTADYNAQIWNYGHGKNGERPAASTHAAAGGA